MNSNYIPEKINNFNTYLNGDKLIGAGASIDIPEAVMKSSTISGAGINGDIDSPTIGQFENMEQVIPFNTIYSSAVDLMKAGNTVDLTHRAAVQIYDKTGGYAHKGIRIVERGRVKSFAPGKLERGETMDATVTVTLTYIMIEVDGEKLVEIDKLNGVYVVGGVDQLAEINALI